VTLFSFGHSTLTIADAHMILTGTDVLVDVRSHPTSRHVQWTRERLEPNLKVWTGIDYLWMPQLGGWDARHAGLADIFDQYGCNIRPYLEGHFPKGVISRKLDLTPPAWTVGGFWDYQWFMTLPEFEAGIRRLIELSNTASVAFMCAEGKPWSCHRSLIADYLLHFYGLDVQHLQPRLAKHSEWPSRLPRYDARALQLMTTNVSKLGEDFTLRLVEQNLLSPPPPPPLV
jgi:hypothetical protein